MLRIVVNSSPGKAPCEQSVSFACLILLYSRKTAKIESFSTPAVPFFLAHDNVTESKEWGLGPTMKSSKNFVEDVLHVARVQFPRPIDERLVQRAHLWSSLYQYKNARGWKNSLRRKNKIDQFSSGYGDFKGKTRFSQSLFFSFSIKEQTKGSSAHTLPEKLRTTQ